MLTIPEGAKPFLPFIQKDDGLTMRQMSVLHVVAANPGVSVGPIAATLDLQKPAVTRAIDKLAAQGLVTRATARGDRRQIAVAITAEGRELLAKAVCADA